MKKFVLVLALLALATASYASGPATVVWSDNFNSYTNGALAGQGGWTSSGAADVVVQDGAVEMIGISSATETVSKTFAAVSGSEIDMHFDVKKQTNILNTMFGIWFVDGAGADICRVYGQDYQGRGRIGGVTSYGVFTGGWDSFDIALNTATKNATFYFNGANLGSQGYGNANTSVAGIRFEDTSNAGAPGESLLFDNFAVGTGGIVTPEPSSLAALGMFGIGLIGTIRRRRS